ncbi:hypothetical protein PFISCL1PPCAC_14665, partial [Pristionchus fissidentatus]
DLDRRLIDLDRRLIAMSDNESDDEESISDMMTSSEEEYSIEQDDESLPHYDTENPHSYLYHDCGPVTFVNSTPLLLDRGKELEEQPTTFHPFPLNIGDEFPYLKLNENDNRVIGTVVRNDGLLISINCGDSDPADVANWLRDQTRAEETSKFSLIDAVALQVVSYAKKIGSPPEKTVAVCRVIARLEVISVTKTLTGLIHSWGRVTTPSTLQSYLTATLSRQELALSPRQKEKSLCHLLALNSRLVLQSSTSASIDRLFSVMKWVHIDVIEKERVKRNEDVVNFLMRVLPVDRCLQHILMKLNCTDAQIALLNSLDYSVLKGVCVRCGSHLFTTDDLVFLKPWLSSAIFVNPAEYVFDTIIVRHTIAPTFGIIDNSFSWFEGYGWRHLVCRGRCITHLGWMFESKTVRPSKFCALGRAEFSLLSEEMKLISKEYGHLNSHPTNFFSDEMNII